MPRRKKEINAEIGARIRELRIARKMSRDELAGFSGYSANFIQEVERGRSGLSSESLRAFSAALNTSADQLLFGSRSEDFSFVLEKLKAVPPEKRAHILKIIEEAIACAQGKDPG